MLYPDNIEYKIGFDQIRELIQSYCLSSLGTGYVERMRFSSDYEKVSAWLHQTHEFKQLLQEDTPFPDEHYTDFETPLSRIRLEGAFLRVEEFFQLKQTLDTIGRVYHYFEQRKGTYPNLEVLFKEPPFDTTIAHLIAEKIDAQGQLRPNASKKLGELSRKISAKEREVRKTMNNLFRKAQDNGWLADTGVTLRDDRLVLPVLSEHKRKIRGFVHDESATGQTFFIEPAEAFDLNNLLKELFLEHRREVERILIALTDAVRPYLSVLQVYLKKLGMIDFIRAKAKFAIQQEAHLPALHAKPGLLFHQARHPLLQIHLKKQKKEVVPLTFELTPDHRVVVISGPNAGGKSVSLKTVALLQYMLQCGLLVPMESHSQAGIFKNLFIDIGDEQSIDNDLSTYSSHLLNMKYFVTRANRQTLFFIDEFGTGTDPQFGGPLAEAILHQLNQRRAMGVVSTHYSNLKLYAENNAGVINASMLFDNAHLQPLYQLEMGKPGSSYAFEIARKTGLEKHILDYADRKIGVKQKKVDDLLVELEREKKLLKDLKVDLQARDREVKGLKERYEEQRNFLEQERKKILQAAKQEALSLVQQANKQVEQTIRTIKETQADKHKTTQAREQLKAKGAALSKDIQTNAAQTKEKAPKQDKSLAVGEIIKLKGTSSEGEVMQVKKSKALVMIGNLKSWIDLDKLERVAGAKPSKKPVTRANEIKGVDLNSKMTSFSGELNVVGKRGEEALELTRQFIDDAVILGFEKLRIVHGRGSGVLRKLIRQELKHYKAVASVSDEALQFGGDGVSLIQLDI